MPGYILAALSSFAVVVAALGPWVTTIFVSAAGTNTPDGKVVLGLGGTALLLVFLRAVIASRTVMVLAAFCGAVGVTIGIVDIVAFNQRLTEQTDTDTDTIVPLQIGWGLWLTPIASAALALASVIVAVTTRRTTARAPRSRQMPRSAPAPAPAPAPTSTSPTPVAPSVTPGPAAPPTTRSAASAIEPHRVPPRRSRPDRTVMYGLLTVSMLVVAVGLMIAVVVIGLS